MLKRYVLEQVWLKSELFQNLRFYRRSLFLTSRGKNVTIFNTKIPFRSIEWIYYNRVVVIPATVYVAAPLRLRAQILNRNRTEGKVI